MGGLIQLAIYAAIAAAVAGAAYGAWSGFKGWIAAPYVAEQVAADQKVVNAAIAERDAARTDVLTAKGNVNRCELSLGVAESGKRDAEQKAKEYLAESRKAKAESDRQRAAAQPYIAGLQADAAAKADKALSCEKRMEKVDKVLTEAIKRGRVPPSTSSPGLVK